MTDFSPHFGAVKIHHMLKYSSDSTQICNFQQCARSVCCSHVLLHLETGKHEASWDKNDEIEEEMY